MNKYNPFNKITGSKKSAISKTCERVFEREVKKIDLLEESTKKIHDGMKKCIKSQAGQSKFELEMVQNMQNNALYRDDETLKKVVDYWLHSAKLLDIQMDELNLMSSKAVIDPMKKFGTIFPSLQLAIKRREQSLQEYTRCQEKVEKYMKRERTGPNATKLESSKKACSIAKLDFEDQNSQLLDEMARLYEGRITYFQPSLHALIKSQVHYYTDSQEIYKQLSSKLCELTNTQSTTDPNLIIQQKLAEIRSLSIAIDDQVK